MRKFSEHSPPFMTFLNIKNVIGRMSICEYIGMGGLYTKNTIYR